MSVAHLLSLICVKIIHSLQTSINRAKKLTFITLRPAEITLFIIFTLLPALIGLLQHRYAHHVGSSLRLQLFLIVHLHIEHP